MGVTPLQNWVLALPPVEVIVNCGRTPVYGGMPGREAWGMVSVMLVVAPVVEAVSVPEPCQTLPSGFMSSTL